MKLASLPRVLRTVRHLRLPQAVAQLEHAVRGISAPQPSGEAPPLAAVGDALRPFLPAPRHARFDGVRGVELIGREVQFEPRVDWDFAGEGPLWAYHLHQMDYLRDPDLTPAARGAWILDWIDGHRDGVGWNPHPICLRVLSWGKLLHTPGALSLDATQQEAVRRSLAQQLATLSRNIEVRLQANHLLSNWIGVVFGGLLLEGTLADGWLAGEAVLRSELDAQVHADGGHQERSPMYHSLLLENVLDLLNLARGVGARAPAALVAQLEEVATRMLAALASWTHPDGEIALLSDSAFGIAHPPPAMRRYAESLGLSVAPPGSGWLRESGTVRLEAGSFSALASVTGPSPAHQPGHAHCDALAFELSVDGERVVTDTGVTEYVPGALRDVCRATSSHATLEVGGADQAELWSAHRIGGRPHVAVEACHPDRCIATCRGWSTPHTTHRRSFRISPDRFEIVDAIEGRPQPVRLFLPLAPQLRTELATDASPPRAELLLGSGRRLRIELPGGVAWRLERSLYFPEFGAKLERDCLVGEAAEFREGRWRFRLH